MQVQSEYGTLDIDFGSGARVAGISGGKGVCIGALAARHYFEMGQANGTMVADWSFDL